MEKVYLTKEEQKIATKAATKLFLGDPIQTKNLKVLRKALLLSVDTNNALGEEFRLAFLVSNDDFYTVDRYLDARDEGSLMGRSKAAEAGFPQWNGKLVRETLSRIENSEPVTVDAAEELAQLVSCAKQACSGLGEKYKIFCGRYDQIMKQISLATIVLDELDKTLCNGK